MYNPLIPETALENKQFEKATSLTESAITGCKDLVTRLDKRLELPKKPLTKQKLILTIITIGSLFIILIIFITRVIISRRPHIRKLYNLTKTPEKSVFERPKGKRPTIRPGIKKSKQKDIWERKI